MMNRRSRFWRFSVRVHVRLGFGVQADLKVRLYGSMGATESVDAAPTRPTGAAGVSRSGPVTSPENGCPECRTNATPLSAAIGVDANLRARGHSDAGLNGDRLVIDVADHVREHVDSGG